MSDYSYIFNAHPTFVESMYKKYLNNPDEVDSGWRLFFEGFDFASNANGQVAVAPEGGVLSQKELSVQSIIHGFRDRGHLLSTTNPIRKRKDRAPHLDLADYNLSESDLDETFISGAELGMENATLRKIIARLESIYCGNIGFEYNHINDREKRMWLRKRIEERDLGDGFGLPIEEKKRILEKLNGAVVFEKFLHTKYIGQKRFSLEGGETTIPALDAAIYTAARHGVKECVIGMAHRGRLNVLANILGKTYEQIFSEFEEMAKPELSFGDGDVKYHLGFSSQVKTIDDEMIDLKLAPNPSHLESVDPVVEGFARAKADILYDSEYDRILPILIHGDAAIAGQGVVYETAQMSKLPGYYTGGTLHFVINNQIGFTTDFDDARSSTYCTGAANMIEAPVFHVNGDDPEAVIFCIKTAVEFRQKFNTDVFVDMVCYRKHGHNEGDDPKFTQPMMYELISKHPNPREVYSKILVSRGQVEADLAKNMEESFWEELQKRLEMVKQNPLPYKYQEPEEQWRALRFTVDPKDFETSPITGIKKEKLEHIMNHILHFPENFKPLSKVNRLLKSKRKLLDDDKLDWALAELMAYGSIMMDGSDVRMSGQDVKRGTFSHRHAMFHDAETFEEYNRLNTMEGVDGKFRIFNSLLSEFAVLGFEYGYSLASPQSLVIWEAQFGDFYNGGQVIVDQYITAAESKWKRMSGLVMLLPHGYAGQGPEHSSARLERFLQAAAEFNITVANCTTPANFFHLLRRQLAREFRKPLVVMSPKSLLRHPKCVSDKSDFYTRKRFQEILVDPVKKGTRIKRILLCSGKIYYDLQNHKDVNDRHDVTIVRLEQLYPLPKKQLEEVLEAHKKAEVYWVQEEPINMGAWQYMLSFFQGRGFKPIGRKSSASPATGFKKEHDEEQKGIVERAFA